MPTMHDKPSDEMILVPDRSTDVPEAAADPVDGMAQLPELVDELAAVDPAAAPDVADRIAARLEEGLDSASGTTLADDRPNSGPSAGNH